MVYDVTRGQEPQLSLFVFVHSECFGYATSVEKNTQCALWLDISDKAGIKLRFAF